MTVLRFKMSGRLFEFDGARDWSAAELWALDDVGVGYEEMLAVLTNAGGVAESRALRVMCALAYICAVREDPATQWAAFSRTIVPATFEVVPEHPTGRPVSPEVAERAEQLAAADVPSLVDLAAQFNQLAAAQAAKGATT